jgi:hypothetical protein
MTRVRGAWSEKDIDRFLEESRIPARISCVTQGGWPMVFSLWYVYSNGKIFCSTQRTAKIIQHVSKNPRCAFEIAGDQPPYRGIRGKGMVVLSQERGPEILRVLLLRYLGGLESSLAKRLLAKSPSEIAIEIEPIGFFAWGFAARMRDSLPVIELGSGSSDT